MVGPPVAVLGEPGLEREAIVQVLVAAKVKIVEAHVRDAGASFVTVLLDTEEDRLWAQARQLAQPVVLVTARQLETVATVDAVMRGADAVVAIDCDPVDLLHAINVVGSGGTLLDADAARVLLQRARTRATAADLQLTAREVDILRSIARGESVKQTARSLGIAMKTVENLRSRLFRKLGVRNRSQAIVRAHDLSLLTDA